MRPAKLAEIFARLGSIWPDHDVELVSSNQDIVCVLLKNPLSGRTFTLRWNEEEYCWSPEKR